MNGTWNWLEKYCSENANTKDWRKKELSIRMNVMSAVSCHRFQFYFIFSSKFRILFHGSFVRIFSLPIRGFPFDFLGVFLFYCSFISIDLLIFTVLQHTFCKCFFLSISCNFFPFFSSTFTERMGNVSRFDAASVRSHLLLFHFQFDFIYLLYLRWY